MNNRARKRLAASALFIACVLALWGLLGTPAGNVALASIPSGGATLHAQQAQSQGGVRRESGPTVDSGVAPRTGPASQFRPLDAPNFGPNFRANTDTQGPPNLAQQEPSIAVNPTNPLNVVTAAKDERGGTNTKQIWIYTSTDGGATWINQLFPFIPPTPALSSDVVINFSDDGICYVTALPYSGGTNLGIQVARSTDGGITFSTGVHLPGTNSNTDKEWTWIDNFPSSPYYHRLYTSWMDFGSGNVWRLNYSSDRGITWSAASAAFSASQFPQPIVLPNGNALVVYTASSGVVYRRSTDGGATFSAVQTISSLTSPQCPPDNSGCGIWRLSGLPAATVDPTNGAIIVTWADGRTGKALTYYSRSTDGGATWSAAAQIAPPGVTNTYQVEPWVANDEIGITHAIWYDDRENPNTSIFNIYYSQSTDDGQTWSTAVRISTATSDLRIGIPSSYSLAAGDYINVTASQGNVYAAWTDTRSGTGEDIYVVRGTYSAAQGTPTNTPSPGGATTTRTATPQPSNTSTLAPSSTRTATQPAATASAIVTVPAASNTVAPSSTAVPSGTVGATSTVGAPSSTVAPSSTAVSPNTPTVPAATASPTICTLSFNDVPTANTFYPYVQCLACRGIISGYQCGGPGEPCPGSYFRPDALTTRGQISKIVSISAGFNDDPGGQIYEDVPEASPFFVWINRLSIHQAMGGYQCGLDVNEPCLLPFNRPYFRPGANATRGQIAKIISIASGLNDDPGNQVFEDVPSDQAFFVWIQRIAHHQPPAIGGYPCGTVLSEQCGPNHLPYFRPGNNVTRGQASKIVSIIFFPACLPAR